MKVRLYVEGGAAGADTERARRFRIAMKRHFERLDPRLKTMEIVTSGSTDKAIGDFVKALNNPKNQSHVALLVDADAEVTAPKPALHLSQKLDSGGVPQSARSDVFLMVQCMEAWLVCDGTALEKCFGSQSKSFHFPQHTNIEAVPKKDIFDSLKRAAKATKKRDYHKIEDAARILTELRPDLVAKRSKHARELHEFLCQTICA